MKKKVINLVVAMVLSSSLVLGLAGCGTQVKATDAEEPMEEETILVTDDGEETDDFIEETVETDSEETVTNETETVGGTIVFYTEWIGRLADEPSTFFEFEEINEEVTVENDAPVMESGMREIGYIKAGTTIRLIEHGINSALYRVENTSGIGYEYVYITGDDLLTLDDMKQLAEKHLGSSEFITILDAPETDMEYIEFSTQKSDSSGVEDYICECLDNENFRSTDYSVFYVECILTGEMGNYMVNYRVYYK